MLPVKQIIAAVLQLVYWLFDCVFQKEGFIFAAKVGGGRHDEKSDSQAAFSAFTCSILHPCAQHCEQVACFQSGVARRLQRWGSWRRHLNSTSTPFHRSDHTVESRIKSVL